MKNSIKKSLSNREQQFIVAGFGIRLGAYVIDIIPILLLVASFFYFVLGFDEVLNWYLKNRGNPEARKAFVLHRNAIRFCSFLVWMLYSAIMEASPMQGTYGKQRAGIKVVNEYGERLETHESIKRNVFKLVSYAPVSLGFIWVAFHKDARGWHDLFAKTYVVLEDQR